MIVRVEGFDHWRSIARRLIAKHVEPHEVSLREQDDQPSLFGEEPVTEVLTEGSGNPTPFTVSRDFLSLARDVGCHRDADRWNLLYRSLWRLLNAESHLLELSTDDDVYRLRRMEQQVRRDAHKMKAFVRFRKITRDDAEYFIAWHDSDHYVLRKVAPFFSRRFKAMNWSVLTPYESASWDQRSLQFGPGVPRSKAPAADELEELWKTYYASIFNPARVKVKAMKNEMPVRYWPTMPETELIPDLLAAAAGRVDEMIATSEGYDATAADFIAACQQEQQQPIATLGKLAGLAARCTACDLHCHATQTVFGEGPETARIILVGEQPGDVEDRQGRPFVGPAGEVLEEAVSGAGLRREDLYLTNVVKHFKFTMDDDNSVVGTRGKRRLHKRPNAKEVNVCRPWLEAEWDLLEQAAVLVCLGATAAGALIAPQFKVSRERGKRVASRLCPQTIATWHPSAVLRAPTPQLREQKLAEMIADLRLAANMAEAGAE